MFHKPGAFFINALSLTNTLYSGMKNKLSLGFSDAKKKKIEKNRRVIDPCGYRHWPLFKHFSHSLLFHFCIFLKTQGLNTLFSESKNCLLFMYSLTIYYSSSTGERKRAEYVNGDEKDEFDIVMQTSSNTQ